jgi:L-alanine-DL-glutamate epimerase-like enolase superfamily enzyme
VGTDLTGPLYHEDDVVTPRLLIEDGHLVVPDGPGIGVKLDQ